MVRFILRRLVAMVLVIIAISMVTFVLLLGTGNQASRLAGRTATSAQVHQIEVKYGFDKPIYTQYVTTRKNICPGQADS
jgi:peptide/nickel transport system permease protein